MTSLEEVQGMRSSLPGMEAMIPAARAIAFAEKLNLSAAGKLRLHGLMTTPFLIADALLEQGERLARLPGLPPEAMEIIDDVNREIYQCALELLKNKSGLIQILAELTRIRAESPEEKPGPEKASGG